MFKDETDEALELKVKNALIDNLSEVRIKFTKKDGTERDMLCTLVESKIPEDKKPKSKNVLKEMFDVKSFNTGDLIERYSNYLAKIF